MASISRPAGALRLPMSFRRLVPAALAVGLLVALGAAYGQLRAYESRPASLDGVALEHDTDPAPLVRELSRVWYETELTLDAGPRVVRLTRRELGAEIDTDAAVRQARLAVGRGPWMARVEAWLTGAERALRFEPSVRADACAEAVEALGARVDLEPVPVSYDGEGGREGVSLSTTGATRAIGDAVSRGALFVRLPVRRLAAPRPTYRDRQNARYDAVVAAHETRYSGGRELAGRARNIYLAARFLDGTIIEPHGRLSFNQIVGERSFERGFAPAIELARGGRRVEGIGGGVCQVAATLHAAAFFGGFDIIEHHPHTRNSSYIPAGLDSAVSWPNKDLVVQNPHPYHVRVRATARHNRLRIELLGQARGPRVEWNTRVVRRIRRQTEQQVDRALASGVTEVEDEGEDGSILERTRTVFWPHGAVTERTSLRYPVVHRLVRVAPGAVETETGSSEAEATP